MDLVAEPYAAAAFGFCALIGAYTVSRGTLTLMGSFNRHFLRRAYNMHQRYGKQHSWAVVTGGSDGIGLEICH